MEDKKTPDERTDRKDNGRTDRGVPMSYSDSYRLKNREKFEKSEIEQIKDKLSEKNIFQNGFKKLERDGEKAVDKIENLVVSRKARKIEKAIVFIVYLLVLGVAIYFLLATFFPDKLPFKSNIYEIKAEDSKIFSSLSSFYIDDQGVLGDKQVIDSTTTRPIISSKKFNFVFSPKENIPQGKNATFELNLLLNKDKPGNIYVNEELIFPDLSNYVLLSQTNTDYIYANKDIVQYVGNINDGVNMVLKIGNNSNNDGSEDDSNNLEIINEKTEDFIYKHLPGASVWATRKLDPVDINLGGYNREWTMINTTFRGDLKLAIYAEGELNIDFIKQDLNGYLGADEYNVTITDSNGSVVYTNIFGDEGDRTKSGKLGKEQSFNIDGKNLKNGIYYVNFASDKNNDYADSTLKNININSNKVLILGNFLPIAPFKFYTKVNSDKKIGFYYWSGGRDQLININNKTNINLSKEWLNKRYDKNFAKGEYDIIAPKGYLWIYNDFSSLSKSNWFDIPPAQQSKFNNPNIILIDKYNFDENLGLLGYKQDVDTSKTPVKISLRVLNSNSASLRDAKMIIS